MCFAMLYSSLYNFKEQKSQCFLVALMKISMIVNIFELSHRRVNIFFSVIMLKLCRRGADNEEK